MMFINNKKKEANQLGKIGKKMSKAKILLCIILAVGFAIRIIGIEQIPNGLNVDEASAAYEASSLFTQGMDRNGKHNPVFLIAWGSGQNALYTYFMIPFLMLLGTTTLAIRLPMAIIGCISLLVFYQLLKKMANEKIALVGTAFLAICPWHMMKSRWGLESNLFPDLMLLSVFLLVEGLERKNKICYYLSFVIAGLSAYSYGTSYFFLPIFLLPVVFLLIKRKQITIKQGILGIGVTGIIALPIIFMILINTFDLPEIQLPFMTIPKLEINRFQEITSIFSGDFWLTTWANIKQTFSILVFQQDGLPWNSLENYGTIYLFSGIFTVIGLIESFGKKKKPQVKYDFIFKIWLLVSFMVGVICDPNINRINVIFFPILYFTILGIYVIIEGSRIMKGLVITLYAICFLGFIIQYPQQDGGKYFTFEKDLQEPIQYVAKLEQDHQIYVTKRIKEPYIYVLWYSKYDTQKFVQTVNYQNPKAEFRQVTSFGNYHFEHIEQIKDEKAMVYLVTKQEIKGKQIGENFTIHDFGNYVVLEGRK